jgi:hypothetical protein
MVAHKALAALAAAVFFDWAFSCYRGDGTYKPDLHGIAVSAVVGFAVSELMG